MTKKIINGKEYIILLSNKMIQPIGSLYSTALPWKALKDISFSNPRVLVGIDDDGKEIYRGIQRALSKERVKQIKSYVNEYDYATFPSSIILNLPHEKVDIIDVKINGEIQSVSNDLNFPNVIDNDTIRSYPGLVLLVFPYEESIAQIIDGQHRMSGFDENSNVDFDLPVTIFIDQLVEQQAEIFSTINGKQTRVTPSLVYELFGISERKSPYKTAHDIIKVLNSSAESPLKGWFKRLGKSNNYYEGYITQSTANQNILKLLCGNLKQVDEDMRVLARGEDLTPDTPFSRKEAPLRKYYIKDDQITIIRILFNFFTALQRALPNEWSKADSIFKKTIGFTALFKVLNDLIPVGLSQKSLSEDFFYSMLSDLDLKTDVTLSSKGINELYDQFFNHYSSKL